MSAVVTELDGGRATALRIGGEDVEPLSGRTYVVDNPATGSVVAEVADAGAVDVDRAVGVARRTFVDGGWRRLPALSLSIPAEIRCQFRKAVTSTPSARTARPAVTPIRNGPATTASATPAG